MKCMRVIDGDISVGGDGKIVMVEGTERIKQELALWLLEPLGTDSVYPKFGADLWTYIGAPAFEDNLMAIRTEVTRVVNNYIAAQNERIAQDKQSMSNEEFLQCWTDYDIVTSISSINVSQTETDVRVMVSLSTAADTEVTVEQTI